MPDSAKIETVIRHGQGGAHQEIVGSKGTGGRHTGQLLEVQADEAQQQREEGQCQGVVVPHGGDKQQ